MGRIIGLIGGTCLLIAVLRLTNLQHDDQTLLGGVESAVAQPQLTPRDMYRKGKELYLRGKFEEALPLLEAAASTTTGLTAVDRRQAEEYLSRTRAKLGQQAAGIRGQSPDADPFAAETAPVADATRTRVERLMAQAQAAAKRGDRQEALKLAQQAQQIAKTAQMKFAKGEISPAAFLAQLQGPAPQRSADLPAWASDPAPVQTAVAQNPRNEIELTGAVEAEPAPGERLTPATGNRPLPAKQQAAALIESARHDLRAGRLDEARRKAMQAEELGVAYDLFDDRPELVLADIDRRAGTTTVIAKQLPEDKAKPAAGAPTRPATTATAGTDSKKQQAARLLELARQDLKNGNLEGAREKAEKAEELGVAYKLFEDRPEVVLNDVAAQMAAANIARQTEPSAPANNPAAPTNESKQQAKQLLAQARQALGEGRVDEARQLAIEADRLKAAYGLFDDRPEIVLADIARAAARGPAAPADAAAGPQVSQTGKPKATGGAQGLARAEASRLLKDARSLMQAGQMEEARAKALAAEKLNVAYDVLADRPDLVLAAIEQATNGNVAARTPQSDPAVQTAAVQTADVNDAAAPAVDFAPAAHQPPPFQDSDALTVASPHGLSAIDHYNRGMAELSRGNRQGAYQSFLAAHQSGQRLDSVRTQRLQDYLRELSPRKTGNGKIQLANNQVADADVAPAPVLDKPYEEPSPLDAAAQQESVKFDRLRTETLNAIFRAERLRDKDPEQALQTIDRATAAIEGAELSEEAAAALLKSLQKTRASLQREIVQQQPNLEMKRHNQETLDKIRTNQENSIRIEQEFAKLVEDYNTLFQQRRFAEAEVLAKKAKELDPKNPVGETMYWKAKIARKVDSNEQLKDRKAESFWQQLDDVEQAVIANVGDRSPIDYGANWQDIKKRRDGKYRADNRSRSEEELRIEQSLEKRISLHEDDVPIAQVISKIATIAGINIVWDSLGLEEENVSSDRPVKIDVDGIKVKSALNLLLEPLHLGYMVQDEVLKITSRIRQQGELSVAVYPVADLVVPIPSFAPTMGNPLGVTSIAPNGGGGGQMSVPPGMGGQPFAQVGPEALGGLTSIPGSERLNGGSPTVDFDTLVDLITTTISPDTWSEVGGNASIRQNGTTLSLVIRQTQKVHEEIADLLDQLRRLQDLQVTIEVRFVTVSDRFFERIGIDFDFNIQDTAGGPFTDNAGVPLLPFGSVLVPQAGLAGNVQGQQGQQQQGQQGQQAQQAQAGSGQFFTTPAPARELHNMDNYPNGGTIVGLANPQQFSTDLDIPFRQGSFEVGVPTFGGFNPNAGVQVGMAVLSDIEAFFFIQAAQGDTRTNLLFAPKVTLFNGQFASVNSTTSRPFVISLIPTVGFFSTGFQPVIQFFPDGVQLFVQAVISADRRYVRLSVTPFFTNITDVFTFSFVGGATANVQGQQGQGGGLGQQGQGGGGFGGGGFGGGQFGIGGGMGTTQMVMNSLFSQQIGQQGGGQQAQQGQRNQAGASGLSVTVQQPVLEIVSVNTTVSVPDGGTVLLGGVKRLREGRTMSGVPILNKVPYISRLFKNTGVGRETESLMLMVTPRIIIQEEEEELLGIPTE